MCRSAWLGRLQLSSDERLAFSLSGFYPKCQSLAILADSEILWTSRSDVATGFSPRVYLLCKGQAQAFSPLALVPRRGTSIWQGRPVLNIFRARSVYFRIEKAIPRFELRIKDLQSFALPLGHIAYIPVSRCLSVILKNIPTTRLTGFEPATSVLTGRCSNLLNYNLFF